MEIFGIRFVGVNEQNLHKLVLTLALVAAVLILRAVVGAISEWALQRHPDERVRFWVWQTLGLVSAALLVLGTVSIWFTNPQNLTTAVGLVTAGLAFALQKVITSFAAYFIILRGRNFTVGDRIVMGGVRGDVIALGFMQTTVMEMGQAPSEQPDAPAMWVRGRQYTGRIVTITNDKIFEQPVYNYSRDFPYIWDELKLPISYKDDRRRAEQILQSVTERHTVKVSEMTPEALQHMQLRYFIHPTEIGPRVYYRLTDNWVEMTVRFVTDVRGTRDLKDAISRDVMDELDAAGIGIASGTYDIVGLPPLRIENGVRVELQPDATPQRSR